MDFDDVINLVRLIAHLLTVYAVCRYHNPSGRDRPAVSFAASIIAGASLGASFHLVWLWANFQQIPGHIFLTIAAIVLAVQIIRTHGNVAHILRWHQ